MFRHVRKLGGILLKGTGHHSTKIGHVDFLRTFQKFGSANVGLWQRKITPLFNWAEALEREKTIIWKTSGTPPNERKIHAGLWGKPSEKCWKPKSQLQDLFVPEPTYKKFGDFVPLKVLARVEKKSKQPPNAKNQHPRPNVNLELSLNTFLVPPNLGSRFFFKNSLGFRPEWRCSSRMRMYWICSVH